MTTAMMTDFGGADAIAAAAVLAVLSIVTAAGWCRNRMRRRH